MSLWTPGGEHEVPRNQPSEPAGQALPDEIEDLSDLPGYDELTPEQVERALDGKLGTVAMTREEFREVLVDLTEFLKAWLRELDV